MHVFVQNYQQKINILKIEMCDYTHDFVGQEKCAKIFQMLQLEKDCRLLVINCK